MASMHGESTTPCLENKGAGGVLSYSYWPRLLFQIRAGPDFAMIRALAELTLTCKELMESSKRPCFERQTGYTTMESFRD